MDMEDHKFVPRAPRRHTYLRCSVQAGDSDLEGFVHNLSVSGLYLRLVREQAKAFEPGDTLSLSFALPGESHPMDERVQVVRSTQEDDGSGRQVVALGVKLVDPTPDSNGALRKFIQGYRHSVLVLDDNAGDRRLVMEFLGDEFHVIPCRAVEEVWEALEHHDISCLISDQRMPKMTGTEVLEAIAARCDLPHMRSIVMSAYMEVNEIQDLINTGKVFHFLRKPFEPIILLRAVHRAVDGSVMSSETQRMSAALEASNQQLREENEQLRRRVETFIPIVGDSPTMQDILSTIKQIAPTDATVMLRGETGTGKEVVARALHGLSKRSEKMFVAVNCAALTESLVESELFGHEKGAFTGANEKRIGRFERANGGTILIDEVGDLPLSVQVKLLRVLQEGRIERIGSNSSIEVDLRIVAATHRNLEKMIDEGTFREDLFYRLNVVPIYLPPLRERREDIWSLVLYYLEKAQKQMGKEGIRLSQRSRDTLEGYNWSGNVRELVNVVERMVALTDPNTTIDMSQMPVRSSASASKGVIPDNLQGKLKDILYEVERKAIVAALRRANDNRTHAAKDLGISRQALVHKIAKFSL